MKKFCDILSKGDWEKDFKGTPRLREQFRKAASKAICSMNPQKDLADCIDDFNQGSRNITELDEEAAANFRFICRSSRDILFEYNSGTYVIEQLSENDTTLGVLNHTQLQFRARYYNGSDVLKYRLHRVFSSGISKPEVTISYPWSNLTNITPESTSVTNIRVGRCNESNSNIPGTTSAEVSFNRSIAPNICFYEVTCRETESGIIIHTETLGRGVYKICLHNLTLDTNFTVTVKGSTNAKLSYGDGDSLTFVPSTPEIPTPTGEKVPHVNITMIASLVGAIVSTISISIIVFTVYIRKKKPTQMSPPHIEVDKFEIEPERLTTTRVLGSGAFGVIKLGDLRDYHGQTTAVAVKMMRDNTSPADLRSFGLEIEMLKALGKHPNIISFIGCCTVGSHPLLVMEYCPQGDLQSFLRGSLLESMISENETDELVRLSPMCSGQKQTPQSNSNNSPTTHATAEVEVVTMMNMLNYGRQIATGMEFLSSKRVVHCDLAARNILLCDNDTVKISDFGLSRDVYQENIYRKTGNGRMPLKWMAIEALTHQIFSTYSDVWSFGVLLWEIVTLGGDPYPGIPTIDILKFLSSGCRMERPACCSTPLYDVMLSCWKTSPKQRPSFTDLRQQLDELITMNADTEYLDIDSLNPTSPENNLRISSVEHNFDLLQQNSSTETEDRSNGPGMSDTAEV